MRKPILNRFFNSLFLVLVAPLAVQAQWTMQDSHTTADLRGIDNVGGGVAWASGTNGTVLRTEDGGYLWQTCAIPPGAEHLDFRGIQAFDADTAIVMSSGKGDLSRLYKTADGCATWKLVFANPDPDGFWDAMQFSKNDGIVLGDPVNGQFELWSSQDGGDSWKKGDTGFDALLTPVMRFHPAPKDEGVFAASNSALFYSPQQIMFVTGGPNGSRLFRAEHFDLGFGVRGGGGVRTLPLAVGSASTGAFSIAWDTLMVHWITVGGDYEKPDDPAGTAASSGNGGVSWHPPQTPPHGYRSAVAYDADLKTWITVGPNGTDISTDDGRNWRAVHPDAGLHEPPDADRNWNALSLPFVVGPHGRIGKLDAAAVTKAK